MEVTEDKLMPAQLTPPEVAEKSVMPKTARDDVLQEFLDSGESPVVLATRHQLPLNEVLHWFRDGKWVSLKRELTRAVREAEDLRYTDLVALNRAQVGSEQLVIGSVAENVVLNSLNAAVENPPGPRDLKCLMEAANAATAIRARVVGLTEKVAADSQAQANAANPQLKATLLVIGARPIGPAPIDVTADVKEKGRNESRIQNQNRQ